MDSETASVKRGMKTLDLGPTGRQVAANVARLRARRGFTYKALSETMEAKGHRIPELGLRRIEAEARRVDADDLAALAVALGVSPLTLLMPEWSNAREVANVTGFGEERGTNVVWKWGLGEEPLTVGPQPDTDVDLYRMSARPLETIEDRKLVVGSPAFWKTGDLEQDAALEQQALERAVRLSEAQGIRRDLYRD